MAVLTVFLLTGCDSGDPEDRPGPSDVDGRYSFTEFVFTPDAPTVQPINVLDTLVANNTHLDLSSGGNYIFAYEFVNGDQFFLSGDFSVTEQLVRIDGDRDDRSSYNRLLLREDFNLRRNEMNPDVLTAEMELTVDPSAFSDRYEGVGSLTGMLSLRLVTQ